MNGGAPGAWDSAYHAPVLAEEILDLLSGAGVVLDCTLGGGGHSEALLAAGSSVKAIDRDPVAIQTAGKRLASFEEAGRFHAYQGNFAYIDRVPELSDCVFDAILADLGVSSHQFDDESRGFTFREGASLDMRMGESDETAADILNTADEERLTEILRSWADERFPRKLAREIVRRRERRPYATSNDLVGAIRGTLGARSGPGDFARIFQAFRIAVNGELTDLDRALPLLRDRVVPGGVIAVIAYHSGEDRAVKNAFRDWSKSCICPPEQLLCVCRGKPLGKILTKKPTEASPAERARNPRARSARLRAWRRAA